MLCTKQTPSFSPQRKPRCCSPAHFEAFLNTNPNPVPKGCSCYVAECTISKPLRGELGDNVIFGALYDMVFSLAQSQGARSLLSWPGGLHREEKSTIPLPSAAAAAPGSAVALIPAMTAPQANPACYFWMLFQLPPISFLILTSTLHSFLLPPVSPCTGKGRV